MSKTGIHWDEKNLADNEEEAANAERMKILEPKTPFHTLGDDGETPNAFPPKAPPARAAGPSDADRTEQLQPGMDLSKLAALAEAKREDAPEEDEVEKHRKFEEHRKAHYQVGGLAALRAQAAAMDEEDDEDEESAR
jgi:protein phosphatase inhibitor 2